MIKNGTIFNIYIHSDNNIEVQCRKRYLCLYNTLPRMTFVYYIYLYACIYYIMQLHSDYILWQPFLDIYSNAIYSLANSKWSMRVRVKEIQTFTFMFLMYVAGKPHSSKRFSWIISAVRLNVYQAQADSIRYTTRQHVRINSKKNHTSDDRCSWECAASLRPCVQNRFRNISVKSRGKIRF